MNISFLILFLTILLSAPAPPDTVQRKENPPEFIINYKNVKGPAWSKGLPVYQVFLQRYTSEATINSFRKSLPKIKDLGVGIIWLMSIHPMGELTEARNPFCVKDHFGIAPALGSQEDLKALVREIHALGMYVILGVVPNHTSYDNPLITSHPEYYEHREDGSIANVDPWPNIAQLDFSKQAVRDYAHDYLEYWIREFDFDGFRCDVAARIPDDFWRRVIPALKEIKPGLFFLAESDQASQVDLFDMVYDWTMQPYLWKILGGEWPATRLDSMLLAEKPKLEKGAIFMHHMDNHDVHNTGYAWPNHRIIALKKLQETTLYEKYGEALRVANLLYATFPGKFMLYNGQEIGYRPSLSHNTVVRQSIDWINDPLRDFYRSLNKLHRNHAAIYRGKFLKLKTNVDDQVYAFVREHADDKVLVVANLSENPHEVQFGTTIPAGEWTDYFNRQKVANPNRLKVEKYGYRVLVANE